MTSPLKAYLLVFNDGQISRELVVNFLKNNDPDFPNWVAFMDNAICFVSGHSSNDIKTRLRRQFPGLEFLVTNVSDTDKNGMLPKIVWDLMKHPEPA